MKRKVPPVKELYHQISKNVLHPNTSFTYELWYSRLVGRRLSIYCTWCLLHTNITPNDLTLACMFIAVIGSVFMAFPNVWSLVLGFFLFHSYIVLDSSDGEIARYRKMTSKLGHYLDGIQHIAIYSSIYIAAGVNIYLRGDSIWWVIAGFAAALVFTAGSFIHHTDPLMEKKGYLGLREKESKWVFYGTNVYNFLRQDLTIMYAILFLAPPLYLGWISIDIFKIVLVTNLPLMFFGGVVFNVVKKIKDPRYYEK